MHEIILPDFNKTLRWLSNNGLLLLEFEELNQLDFIQHGFVAKPSLQASELGTRLGLKKLINGKQVHQDLVAVVNHQDQIFNGYDAFITQTTDITLVIKVADCQAAYFVDPVQRAIGLAHSGWRGSVLNIYQKTIEAMQKNFGTKSKDLIVAISPSLGPEKAEFVNYEKELPPSFWRHQVKPNYFDFWKISKDQLLDIGVMPNKITFAGLCTHSHPDLFFSYRRDKTTERHLAFLTLKPSTS